MFHLIPTQILSINRVRQSTNVKRYPDDCGLWWYWNDLQICKKRSDSIVDSPVPRPADDGRSDHLTILSNREFYNGPVCNLATEFDI